MSAIIDTLDDAHAALLGRYIENIPSRLKKAREDVASMIAMLARCEKAIPNYARNEALLVELHALRNAVMK